MRRTIGHLLRAAIVLAWLYCNYRCDGSPTVLSVLALAAVYDIAVACFHRIRPETRQMIALMFAPTAMAFMLMERKPWDDSPGYMLLLLYLPEIVVNVRRRGHRVAVLSVVTVARLLAAFFSLYRLGWVTARLNATIAGRPVPCRVVKVVGTPYTGLIVDEGWVFFGQYRHYPTDPPWWRSLAWSHIAFVDVRCLNSEEMGWDKCEGQMMWNPNVTYENGHLSFYIQPKQLFVCDGVKM